MQILEAGAAVALLASIASAASTQHLGSHGGTAAAATPSPDEIVVTGRRDGERYRIPPRFRTATEAGDRWRRSFARDSSCRNVGPRGCGLQPNPLITFRADGSVQLGDHRSAN